MSQTTNVNANTLKEIEQLFKELKREKKMFNQTIGLEKEEERDGMALNKLKNALQAAIKELHYYNLNNEDYKQR